MDKAVAIAGSRPFDLRFTGPAGERHTGAHVVQVSNNPYGGTARTLGSRPRLDSGRLGVITLELPQGPPDRAFIAAIAAGHPDHLPGFVAWEALTFEVDSGNSVNVGIDGEAIRMGPRLRFTIRPGALRVCLPKHASGLSPAARELRRRARLAGWDHHGRRVAQDGDRGPDPDECGGAVKSGRTTRAERSGRRKQRWAQRTSW